MTQHNDPGNRDFGELISGQFEIPSEADPQDKPRDSANHEQRRLLDSYWGCRRASEACAELAERFGDAGEVYEVSEPGIRGIVNPDAGSCRVAHEALLSAFSELMWESEGYLEALRTQWPELRGENGGALPLTWAEHIEKLHKEHPQLRAVESEDTERAISSQADSVSVFAMPSLALDDDDFA